MAWNTPATAVTGNIARAADFNTHRDDLNYLKGSVGPVTIDNVLQSLLNRQGGIASGGNWFYGGTTKYQETSTFLQVGCTRVVFSNQNVVTVNVTLPTALQTSQSGLVFFNAPAVDSGTNVMAWTVYVASTTQLTILGKTISGANTTFTADVGWIVIGR